MSIKTKIPSELVLKQVINNNLNLYVEQLRSSIGHLEDEYTKKLKGRTLGTFYMIFGVFFAYIPFLVEGIIGGELVSISMFFAGLVMIFIGWRMARGSTEVILAFNTALNQNIYDITFSLFDLEKDSLERYGKTSLMSDKVTTFRIPQKPTFPNSAYDIHMQVVKSLDESELITEFKNEFVVDDSFVLKVQRRDLRVSELDVKSVTGSGKSKQVKNLFKGLFVSLELPKTLVGKTFVSTEGDKNGFGHQSFFNNITGNEVQPTELEWNDFENLLHVVTSNPTEARYVLTPDFMSDLHDWWKDKKFNIRLVFKENKMFMLFPDDKIRLDTTIRKISPEEIRTYIESVAIPCMHIFHLAEDVEKRFSS